MGDGTGFEMEIVGENFFSDGVVEVHCCFWGGVFSTGVSWIGTYRYKVVGVNRLFRLSLSLSLAPHKKKDAFFKEEEIKS